MVILVVGSMIISAKGVLGIVSHFRVWDLEGSPRDLMYAVDGKFQLQRIVLEDGGYGTWDGYSESTPWSTDSTMVPLAFWRGKVPVKSRQDKSLPPDRHHEKDSGLPQDNGRQSGVLRNEHVEEEHVEQNEPVEKNEHVKGNENGSNEDKENGQAGEDKNDQADEAEPNRDGDAEAVAQGLN